MSSTAHPGLDSESAQLRAWLSAADRQPGMVNVAHVERVKARLKEIEDVKRAQKKQAKRAKKLWGVVTQTIDQHNPVAGQHLRTLAASPTDNAALAGVMGAIMQLTGKNPALAQAVQVGLPLVKSLLVDDDDNEED